MIIVDIIFFIFLYFALLKCIMAIAEKGGELEKE